MLIQHTPVCLGWNEERAILPSGTGEETQAGLHFLELKQLRKSCLDGQDSELLGQRCLSEEILKSSFAAFAQRVLSQDP